MMKMSVEDEMIREMLKMDVEDKMWGYQAMCDRMCDKILKLTIVLQERRKGLRLLSPEWNKITDTIEILSKDLYGITEMCEEAASINGMIDAVSYAKAAEARLNHLASSMNA